MHVVATGRPVRRVSRGGRWIAAGCVTGVITLLAGCHVPGITPAAGRAPSGSSIAVAAVPGIGSAPLYIAVQEGLFRQAGLTVHIHSYSSVTAQIAALRSGKDNVAVGNYADFFYAQEHDPHAPMVLLADGYDAGPNVMNVLVKPNSGITGPQDLLGKTIGTAAPQLMPDIRNGQPYSLDTLAASSVLMNDGIQPTAVTWRPMPANDLIRALRSSRVDAILVAEPQTYQAESQLGAQSVLDACSGQTVSLPLEGYFALASFATQHRAPLQAFRSALMRAQDNAAGTSLMETALTHYAGMSSQTASMITLGVYPTSLKQASLQRVADLMSFYGALPHPLDVTHMIFR